MGNWYKNLTIIFKLYIKQEHLAYTYLFWTVTQEME